MATDVESGAQVTQQHLGPRGRMSRAFLASASGAFRRHHVVLLYAIGGFFLVRMWFFAFAHKDSRLISFCAFVMVGGVKHGGGGWATHIYRCRGP
jgi:hypothetical protein